MIEQYGEGTNKFFTDSRYWDCECKNNYIHLKKTKICPKCKASIDDCPASRTDEVNEFLGIAYNKKYLNPRYGI